MYARDGMIHQRIEWQGHAGKKRRNFKRQGKVKEEKPRAQRYFLSKQALQFVNVNTIYSYFIFSNL
jgi:hypothetical protein